MIPRLRHTGRRVPEQWACSEPCLGGPIYGVLKVAARREHVQAWGEFSRPELRLTCTVCPTGATVILVEAYMAMLAIWGPLGAAGVFLQGRGDCFESRGPVCEYKPAPN